MTTILNKKELLKTLFDALKHKQYEFYDKSMWSMVLTCPDFLDRCRVSLSSDGVEVEFAYPTDKLIAKVVDPQAQPVLEVSYEDLWYAYATYLDTIDPMLNIMLDVYPIPKSLWDILYSLASVIFNMKIGRGLLNIVAPYTHIYEGNVVVGIRKVPKEEAKSLIREWVYQFAPQDYIEDLIKELQDERLVMADLTPLVRLNLIYEVIMLKGRRAYIDKLRSSRVFVRKCPYCGKEFTTQNKRAVFCSQRCSADYQSLLNKKSLIEEYKELKSTLMATGLSPEEATEKAVHQMIEKYPFLSKAKRQELGIGRKRRQAKDNTDSQSEG